MVDFSVASRNCVPYLVPISEARDPTVPWPSYHWRNPVSDLIRAKWRNSLGMCLLSGYHLVIWERIYLTEWGGAVLLCFSCFRQWCASWSWCVYSHRTFHHFQGNGLYTPAKKTHSIHTGTLLWMSNTKEWSKLRIPHRFRDEVWWSGRWTVYMKRKQLEFLQPCWHFMCLTLMSHHLPHFKNRTSSPPSLWDVKWPGYLHHFPLLCYVPWRFVSPPAKQTRDPGMNQSASHPNRGPKPLSPIKNDEHVDHTPLNMETNHGCMALIST